MLFFVDLFYTLYFISSCPDYFYHNSILGVMDDRGKFIYISEEELNNIAKFIKQRGRVSIADLAESSNSLIKLQDAKTKGPKSVDVSA